MLMLSTYSSYCMVDVISKKLSATVRQVNKAVKLCNVSPSKEIPNVAAKAAEVALATILAIDKCDHFRCDTEDSDSVDAILQRIGKLLKDIFWFTDAELGWKNDPYTRKALLKHFDSMEKEWHDSAGSMGYELKTMKYKSPKNQQGLGRKLEERPLAGPRPAKKAKIAVVAGTKSLTSFFSNIHDKLTLRVKTIVQLKIASLAGPTKCDYVVVSGATDMKKLNHMVAYVTGCTSEYTYHYQRGKSRPGSRFELCMDGYKTCWMRART